MPVTRYGENTIPAAAYRESKYRLYRREHKPA